MSATDDALTWVVGVLSLAVLVAVLALTLLAIRRPRNALLVVAGGLLVAIVLLAVFAPVSVPWPLGIALALVASAVSIVGGYPVASRVLELAMGPAAPAGAHGGIIVSLKDADNPTAAPVREEVLRGGMTIGVLERTATTVALIAGFPEALAILVALKGVGRFTELATPAARERFIVGTLASLVWASLAGAVVRLLVW